MKDKEKIDFLLQSTAETERRLNAIEIAIESFFTSFHAEVSHAPTCAKCGAYDPVRSGYQCSDPDCMIGLYNGESES